MSYVVELIVNPVPLDDSQAWNEIESLRPHYYGDEREKASALVELHSLLTARYPCLCSYADDDPNMDESPWADGPMIGNFAHEMGMLAITFSRVEEVVPFIIQQANALGITVGDSQTGNIYRPQKNDPQKSRHRPWWKFWN